MSIKQIQDKNVTVNSNNKLVYFFQQDLYIVKSFSLVNVKVMRGFPVDLQTLKSI